MDPRPVTFLSDYGHDDEFAGVCRAVIRRICPEAVITDLTHAITPFAVAEGGAVLARALRYCAPGVHLAVVDPGVGSPRRAIAVRAAAEDRLFVGPDNGLLTPALEEFGGGAEAVDLERSRFRLEPVSATFHGRDLFAPVAAHLAMGASLAEAGEAIDPSSLVPRKLTGPHVQPGVLTVRVVSVDRFGNVALDANRAHLSEAGLDGHDPLRLEVGGRSSEVGIARTFAEVEVGVLILYESSYGALGLGVNQGSAAAALELARGDELTLCAP